MGLARLVPDRAIYDPPSLLIDNGFHFLVDSADRNP
jgi:hypothetical protein